MGDAFRSSPFSIFHTSGRAFQQGLIRKGPVLGLKDEHLGLVFAFNNLDRINA